MELFFYEEWTPFCSVNHDYWFLIYCKTKKSAALSYIDMFYAQIHIRAVSDSLWHDSLSIMYYIDKESYRRLSETHPIVLCIKQVSK